MDAASIPLPAGHSDRACRPFSVAGAVVAAFRLYKRSLPVGFDLSGVVANSESLEALPSVPSPPRGWHRSDQESFFTELLSITRSTNRE